MFSPSRQTVSFHQMVYCLTMVTLSVTNKKQKNYENKNIYNYDIACLHGKQYIHQL